MKLTLKDKRYLLMKLFEIYLIQGYDITDWMGKPLSFFDYKGVIHAIIKEEQNYYGSSSLLEYYPKYKKFK